MKFAATGGKEAGLLLLNDEVPKDEATGEQPP